MELKGVILAAGKGTRIYPFSESYPKPILPIANKPLMAYQLELMASIGIRDVIVVIGYLGYEIVRRIGQGEEYGLNIRYIEQKDTLGIAHALGCLENELDTPFMLFLGDIFFEADDIGRMVSAMEEDDLQCVIATKIEEDREMIRRNFAVVFDEDNFVKRVIEKPRHISNNHKGCGFYLFDLHIFDAIRRTPRTAMRDEYEITDSIQILINDGGRVRGLEVVKEDTNLTFPQDLLNLNMAALNHRGIENLFGKDMDLHPGAKFKNCVIGDGARVAGPCTLRNCLVFDKTEVPADKYITNSIITPDRVIQLLPEKSI